MSVKRQRKVARRGARMRKSASPARTLRPTAAGDLSRSLPDRDSLMLSDVVAMLRSNVRGPREEGAYDYCADDHDWFVVPHADEPFELPLPAELESNWQLLAEEDPACAPISRRIRELRTAGRTHCDGDAHERVLGGVTARRLVGLP